MEAEQARQSRAEEPPLVAGLELAEEHRVSSRRCSQRPDRSVLGQVASSWEHPGPEEYPTARGDFHGADTARNREETTRSSCSGRKHVDGARVRLWRGFGRRRAEKHRPVLEVCGLGG